MSRGISRQIREAELSDEQVLAFCQALRALARAGGPSHSAVAQLESRLREGVTSQTIPAPVEELWQHRELFLRACITAAVCEGEYSVESARIVGDYARNLGISARQLSEFEARVMGDLIVQGRSFSQEG